MPTAEDFTSRRSRRRRPPTAPPPDRTPQRAPVSGGGGVAGVYQDRRSGDRRAARRAQRLARPSTPFVSETPGGGQVTPEQARAGVIERHRLQLQRRREATAYAASHLTIQPQATGPVAPSGQDALRSLRELHAEVRTGVSLPGPHPTPPKPTPLNSIFDELGAEKPAGLRGIQQTLSKDLKAVQNAPVKRAQTKAFKRGGETAVADFLRHRKRDGARFSREDLLDVYKGGGVRAVETFTKTKFRPQQRATTPTPAEVARGREADVGDAYLRVLGLDHIKAPLGERIYGTIADWAPMFVPVGGGVYRLARGTEGITEVLRGLTAVRGLVRGGQAARTAGARAVGTIGERFAGSQAARAGFRDLRIARQAEATQGAVSAAQRAQVVTALPRSATALRAQQIARARQGVQEAETANVVARAKILVRTRPVDALRVLDQLATRQRAASSFAFLAAPGGSNLATLPVQVARAYWEDPNVRKESFRALKALPREFVNGAARTAFQLVTDPTQVPKDWANAYARTYGPLVTGDNAEFRRRLGERGGGGIVGPILDVAFIAAPAASRLLGGAAKRGALGPQFEKVMQTERPLLQIGEGESAVRRQHASPRLFKRLSEERRDRARRRYSEQQVRRADEAPTQGEIPPDVGRHRVALRGNFDQRHWLARDRPNVVAPRGRGTVHFRGREVGVTPRYPSILRRDVRETARIKAQAIVKRGQMENRLVQGTKNAPGAARLLDTLSPEQQIALFDVFQLGVDASSPRRFTEAVAERIQQIKDHNLQTTGLERPDIPRKRRAAHDELAGLEIVAQALKDGNLIDENFVNVAERMKAIQREVEEGNVRLNTQAIEGNLSEADMRVAKPYVEFLLKWDRRHRGEKGGKRSIPEFAEGKWVEKPALFEKPEFAHYINEIVQRSKYNGLDALAERGRRRGLLRPHYVASERRDVERFGSRTVGGSRGVRRKQRYVGSLFRTGRQSRNPRVFIEGIRRSIKDTVQPQMVLDVAERMGFNVLDELKAETMDYVQKTKGINDVVRSGSGKEIDIQRELRGLSPSEQFDKLVERRVIDPYDVALTYLDRHQSQSGRLTPDEAAKIKAELDNYRPREYPDASPFDGVGNLERNRIANVGRVMRDHDIMPPLLKAMLDSEERFWQAVKMVQPQGEPLLLENLTGPFADRFHARIDSADKVKALFDGRPSGVGNREIIWQDLFHDAFDSDSEAFDAYITEMRRKIYAHTQKSLEHRGLNGKIIVWRVGPLYRTEWDRRTPLSFSLDPQPLADFRHSGRRAAIPYEVDASVIVGDANAVVRGADEVDMGGPFGVTVRAEDLDPVEKAAMGDEVARAGEGATGSHRYAHENEVLIHPDNAKPITDNALREKIAITKHAAQLRGVTTGKELLDAFDELGLKSSDYVFYNPGVMFDRPEIWKLGDFRDLDQAQARGVMEAFNAATIDGAKGRDALLNSKDFSEVSGFIPIPRHVYDEIAPVMNKKFLRSWDIAKNKFSRILLGLFNFSWVGFQIGANAFLTGMAKVGPLEFFRAQQWWKGLDAETKRALDPVLNIEPHLLDTRQRFLGFESHDSDVSARYRAFRDSDLGTTFSKYNITRHVMDASFRVDRAQTAAFRRAVFYNSVKKEALQNMGASVTDALAMQGKLTRDLFKRDPMASVEGILNSPKGIHNRANLERQMDMLMRNRVALEHHARVVDEWLGDYVSFSSSERAVLQRFVMFYGFLRHSLRFAFWTLPTRHPIMAGIFGKLAIMSDKETREMLGLDDLPTGLAGLTFNFGGKTMQINFGRMSPTGNIAFESSNPLAVFGMLPPMVTLPLAATGFNFFTGRFSQVSGENRYEAFQRGLGGLSILDRIKLLTHDAEQLIPPLRAYEQYAFKGPQGEDTSVVFGASPTQLTEAKHEVEQEIKRQEKEGLFGILLRQFGTRAVDPGYLRYLREQEADKAGKSIGGGSGSPGFNFGSSSGGGTFQYGGGSSGSTFHYGGS